MSKTKTNSALLLLVCAIGICFCYLYYGLILEELNKQTKDARITTFLLFTQSANNALWAAIFRVLIKYYDFVISIGTKPKLDMPQCSCSRNLEKRLNHSLLLIASFCYFAAMSATNESLSFVSYPSATLAKSCKLIPTMLMGYFFEQHCYSRKEILGVFLITSGIIVFNASRISNLETADSGGDSPYGLFLLFLSLVIDGLTNSIQSILKKETSQFKPPSTLEAMFWTNFYSTLFFLPAALVSNQWYNGLALARQDGIVATYIKLDFLAMFGQVFIFLTIQHFTPLICTTITTTRKFFTILLSVMKFGHIFSCVQWMSIMMVFVGLFLEISTKKIKKA